MRIGVLGATGGTGSAVVRHLLAAGHSVRAAVRRPDAAQRLSAAGVEPMVFDLTTASGDELAAAFEGLDGIVNAAASGASLTGRQARRIDHDGVLKAVGAAEKAGASRWIQISMMGSDNPSVVPIFLRRIAVVKGQADQALSRSSLVYTVIRPPWLGDGPASASVTVAKNLSGGSLTRATLAVVAVAALDEPATEMRMFDVASGAVPLAEALRSVSGLA
jgi:uncharacterized protein YbjT (DUF2867 family)